MRVLALMSLVLLALTGCQSYSWRSQVPEVYRSVSVPTFRNETTIPTAGSVVTRQLAREFQREGTFRIDGSDAAIEVQGAVTAVEFRGDGFRRVFYSRLSSASVIITVKVSVIDRQQGKVLIDNRSYSAEMPYADGSDMTAGRDLAIERAADELSREIVDDLLLFNWKEKAK